MEEEEEWTYDGLEKALEIIEKAKTKLGWSPKCSFDSLVEMMAKADLENFQ